MIAIPALQRSTMHDGVSSNTLTKQWRQIFEAGKAQNPPVAAVAACGFAYLSWSSRSKSASRISFLRNAASLYSAAAVLTLGIVPFTILTMRNTNNALCRASEAKQDASIDNVEARMLTSKWIQLNAVRSCLPLAGGILGVVAITIC